MRQYKSHFNFQGHHPKARPWKRQGFVRNAMRYAAVLLFGLMLLVGPSSCKKDPSPNPTPAPTPTPTDTITPTPGDTINPTPWDTIVPTPPTGGKVVNFYYNGGGDCHH